MPNVNVLDYIPSGLHAAIADRTNSQALQTYIQAAIDAAAVDGGGEVAFPPGDYKLTAELTVQDNAVYLRGSGRANTRIYGSTAINGIHWSGAGDSIYRGAVTDMQLDNFNRAVWLDFGTTAIEVERLTIVSCLTCVQVNGKFNQAVPADSFLHTLNDLELVAFTNLGLYFYHCGDSFVSNVKTESSIKDSAVGLAIDTGTTALHVWDCNFAGCLRGVHIRNTLGISPNPVGLVERPAQCFFTNVLGDTCKDYGWYLQSAQQMSFVGCWGGGANSGAGYGFYIGPDVYQLDFTNTHLIGNWKDGMRIVGPNPDARITVNGGYAYGNGFAATNTYDGVSIESGVKHVKVTNLHAYNDHYGRRDYSGTWDPPVVANGASTSIVVSVPGVTTAWVRVTAALSSLAAGWTLGAAVTAADQVTVTLTNNTGASGNLGSGALSVSCLDPKSNALSPTQRYGVFLWPDQAVGATPAITGATQANPVVVTSPNHGFINGQDVEITGVGGMTNLNGNVYVATLIDKDHFSLGVDGSAFGAYTSGGVAQRFDKSDYLIVALNDLSGNLAAGVGGTGGLSGTNKQITLNV